MVTILDVSCDNRPYFLRRCGFTHRNNIGKLFIPLSLPGSLRDYSTAMLCEAFSERILLISSLGHEAAKSDSIRILSNTNSPEGTPVMPYARMPRMTLASTTPVSFSSNPP